MARPVEVAYVRRNGLFYTEGLDHLNEESEKAFRLTTILEKSEQLGSPEWVVEYGNPWVFVNYETPIPDQGGSSVGGSRRNWGICL
ncbi:hypothetical protein ACTOVN_06455 [Arcanobacterium canis]